MAALNSWKRRKYLYLRKLAEPRDNSLMLVVEEAVVNHAGPVPSRMPELAFLVQNASPIDSVDGCRCFQLYWKRCVAYLVTEELVGSNSAGGYADEMYSGRILRHYTQSHFLDHLARDTGGHTEPLQHWKLVCLNHLVDVAAYESPEITVLPGGFDEADPNCWR